MVDNLQRAIVLEHLPTLPDGIEAEDPNDAFLLAMALAGEVDYLVTGDRRAGLLQRGRIGRARIVTPAAFCAEVLRGLALWGMLVTVGDTPTREDATPCS